MKVAAIVPSLNPDERLTLVVDGLIAAGFSRIYVVNDGSGPAYQHFFDAAAAKPQCVLLTHEMNRGKGRALKTAMERYLSECDGYAGVVTLDADGQHGADDVARVAEALETGPEALVLGVRDFSLENVPAKNAYGNRITRTVFRWFSGLKMSDTQTGLRAIPNDFARRLLSVKGERYEFETNMLLETKRADLPIREVPIATIYLEENASSHFRPFKDSVRIYALILKFFILKFTLSSLLSAGLDLGLFALLDFLLRTLLGDSARWLVATVAARVVSALFNFTVNRTLVFSSDAKTSGALLRYGILAVVQMLCSYGGVALLSGLLPLPATLAKIITDTVLFFISFFIQRRWVFRK